MILWKGKGLQPLSNLSANLKVQCINCQGRNKISTTFCRCLSLSDSHLPSGTTQAPKNWKTFHHWRKAVLAYNALHDLQTTRSIYKYTYWSYTWSENCHYTLNNEQNLVTDVFARGLLWTVTVNLVGENVPLTTFECLDVAPLWRKWTMLLPFTLFHIVSGFNQLVC